MNRVSASAMSTLLLQAALPPFLTTSTSSTSSCSNPHSTPTKPSPLLLLLSLLPLLPLLPVLLILLLLLAAQVSLPAHPPAALPYQQVVKGSRKPLAPVIQVGNIQQDPRGLRQHIPPA